MGGIFGIAAKKHCEEELFFGTDYHSHLGTCRGGMAVKGNGSIARFIHDITNDQFVTDAEAANQIAASDIDNTLVNGAEVDFTTAQDPFGDLGGLNTDKIKNTPENNTGQSITNQGGGPGDPVPTIKPAATINDIKNLRSKLVSDQKNWAKTVGAKALQYRDPMLAYGAYTFDQYASNVDRYRGYGTGTRQTDTLYP